MSTPKSFKTNKGTELPLLDLRGQMYLQVKDRLVWFREERHDWSIKTEFVAMDKDRAIIKASILDSDNRVIATAHKVETAQHFADFVEKAETGAIGRALAMCGYGTQFVGDEFTEGERLADSPHSPVVTPRATVMAEPTQVSGDEPYTIPFGKFKGMTLEQVAVGDLISYVDYLERTTKTDKPQSPAAKRFIEIARLHVDKESQLQDVPF